MFEFFAQMTFLIGILSPIFAYRAGRKTLGRINLVTVFLFLISWIYVISTYVAYNHPMSIFFYILIVVNCSFAIGNSMLFLRVRNPSLSWKKLLAIVLSLTALCFVFVELTYPTNVLIDTLLQTVMLMVPLFVCGAVWVRLRQIDREPEHI